MLALRPYSFRPESWLWCCQGGLPRKWGKRRPSEPTLPGPGIKEELALTLLPFTLLSLSVQAAMTEMPSGGLLERQTWLSHSPGGRESKVKVLGNLVSGEAQPTLGLQNLPLTISSPGRGRWGRKLCSTNKGTNPFKRAPPSRPTSIPKAPPPNTDTLAVRISTYEFWRVSGGHIQSMDIQSITTT